MRILIRVVLWTWFLAALIGGQLGLLGRLSAPAVQGIFFGLTALLITLCLGVGVIRTWIKTIDLRALVLLHVSRFVAYSLLVLYRRGELPAAFAIPAGWGEIVVAGLALLVVVLPLSESVRHRACVIWNTVGLVDILLIVAAASRLGFSQPWRFHAWRVLPFSILPTFLVPLIIVTHVIIYVRLSTPAADSNRAAA